MARPAWLIRLLRDPRHYQIACLGSLLVYGVTRLHLEVVPSIASILLATALGTQWLLTRAHGQARFEPRSALISGLSLCLLLRTNEPLWAIGLAFAAIASKFWLRVGDKHLFNPTNFAIVLGLLLTERVWVSPGQWGSLAFFALAVAAGGSLVVTRAARADVSLAFLAAWASVLFGRMLWLGTKPTIPLHQLENGALLIFTFFMISDPKTTPNSRLGRILFACLVAAGAGFVQFGLFRTNGLLWSLAVCSVLVPLIDRLLPADRYVWSGDRPLSATPEVAVSPLSYARSRGSARQRRSVGAILLLAALFPLAPSSALAFCGFYVGKADTKLFNQASQVVLVRDGDRTVMTMMNDYRGDLTEFAIVVPTPTFLEEGQIHVTEAAIVEHLDAYTAPRLVEYFDEDPCSPRVRAEAQLSTWGAMKSTDQAGRANALGVTIEARYTVGEYDILILSARESDGLETWLRENGYKVPEGASRVLGSYLKQGMRFFVAKVNLAEMDRLGFANLRPLQIAYEHARFMLPIRLGIVNADGAQELFVYALTRTGRVETTNYRTVRLPSDAEIPIYVKEEFSDFYRAMFTRQVEKEGMRTVFLEYAWDMGWCDPCAADPLTNAELQELGVFWLDDGGQGSQRAPRPMPPNPGGASDVFVSRLHVRYDAAHFPEDLVFQETGDRTNFQGRYILRHPYTGRCDCPEGDRYRTELRHRMAREAETLASLTGWDIGEIHRKSGYPPNWIQEPRSDPIWWKKLWAR